VRPSILSLESQKNNTQKYLRSVDEERSYSISATDCVSENCKETTENITPMLLYSAVVSENIKKTTENIRYMVLCGCDLKY
jgi:hypothetical protein